MFKLLRNLFKNKKAKDWEGITITFTTPMEVWGHLITEEESLVKLRKGNKTSFKKGHTPWNKGKKKGTKNGK